MTCWDQTCAETDAKCPVVPSCKGSLPKRCADSSPAPSKPTTVNVNFSFYSPTEVPIQGGTLMSIIGSGFTSTEGTLRCAT